MISRREFSAVALAAMGIGSDPLGAQQAAVSGQARRVPLVSEFLMDLVLDVGEVQTLGARRIVAVTGGSFAGPRVKGNALPGGGDWVFARPDGVSEINARVTLRTDDEQLLYLQYSGVLFSRKDGMQYWRMIPAFETSSPKYDWLTRIIAVGVGRAVPNKAAYSIYEIL